MDNLVAVGRIVSTQGLKGFVKVVPLTDSPNRFLELKEVLVGNALKHRPMVIKQVRVDDHKNLAYLLFDSVENVDQANALREAIILIPKEQIRKLPEGTYYQFDIIGIKVFDLKGTYLGKVAQILETGANDVYILNETESGKPVLIPALKAIIQKIDIEEREMYIDPPPGLLDI